MESLNHRTVGVGRNLWGASNSPVMGCPLWCPYQDAAACQMKWQHQQPEPERRSESMRTISLAAVTVHAEITPGSHKEVAEPSFTASHESSLLFRGLPAVRANYYQHITQYLLCAGWMSKSVVNNNPAPGWWWWWVRKWAAPFHISFPAAAVNQDGET